VSIRVLALDLERTLIDDALSARPRPGLFGFLAFCQERFERLVLFTSVEEADARAVMEGLARGGHVPPPFLARLEYVAWSGEFKDLGFVPGAATDEVLLVDDDAGWVRPDQRDRWVAIADGEAVEDEDDADTQQAQPQAARILAVGIIGAGDDVVSQAKAGRAAATEQPRE
jgi:hypothetical protein